MSDKTIRLTSVTITLSNEIFHVSPHPQSAANLEIMQEVHNTFKQLSQGEKHPALIDMTQVKTMDYESRKYIAEKTGDVISAVALITNSPISRVIGNFFIGINKPNYPAKLFNNKEEALIWLQEHNHEQKQ